jgi:YHS domain-containing protein
MWTKIWNGEQLTAIYGNEYDFGSQTIMVQFNENDKAWVQHFFGSVFGYINNEADRRYTTFTGALIVAF